MADEGFESYHIPQQSRRDKLRVVVAQNQQEPLLPFYDSSSFINPHHNNFTSSTSSSNQSAAAAAAAASMNVSSSSSNSSSNNTSSLSLSHHAYLDPAAGLSLPFLYQPQNLPNFRDFDDQRLMFKPEALSLSLSSHRSGHQGIFDGSGGGCVISGLVGGGGSSVSGPFTGYASVLKDSRFLKPAQELLEEMCDVGGSSAAVCAEKLVVVPDASLMEPLSSERSLLSEDPLCHDAGGEGRKKSRLLTMLDEVYRRYRQYYQQMQAVVTSFEYVSSLSNAAPYASLAIKSMSKHFRCLKKAITDQIQFNNKAHFHMSNRKDESPRFGNSERGGPYSQRSGFLEHQQPVWRPQRGLPDRAVNVLRAWLFEHFLHPYPTDTDKLMLAKQTGLSRNQVSNWFINARVRLWKPMVEEIHMLETRQARKNSQKEEHCRNKSSDHLPSDTSLVSENPSTSTDKFQDATYRRAMNELPNIPIRSQEQQLINLPQPVGVGMSMGGASSNNNNNRNNNSVSLTLGLYQNHGIGLAEPFPLSAAQRFGLALETNNEGYVMSGFESQNRHFGRDVIGGQMFRDFVG